MSIDTIEHELGRQCDPRVGANTRHSESGASEDNAADEFETLSPAWFTDMLDLARENLEARPKRRAECLPGGSKHQRPCPWVLCRYHAAIVENEYGRVRGRHEFEPGKSGRRPSWPRKLDALPVEVERLRALADTVLDGRPTCTLDVIEQYPDITSRRHAIDLR